MTASIFEGLLLFIAALVVGFVASATVLTLIHQTAEFVAEFSATLDAALLAVEMNDIIAARKGASGWRRLVFRWVECVVGLVERIERVVR